MKSGAAPPSLRLFVACDLPSAARATIAAWQNAELEPHDDVRLNRALHITLAFLGQIPSTQMERLTEALAELAYPPLRSGVREVIFLPERGAKRIVALHLDDPGGALAERQRQVSAALAATGLYRPEKRPWLPHLTVARFRRPGHPFSLQNVNIRRFGVVRTVLYSSVLERAGAVHTPLTVFPAS
jgi:RNA 2',3'-cyclic 3'-phosphodiesterase